MPRARHNRKKPVGMTGPVRLSGDGSQEWMPLNLPTDKEGIEFYFAERFLSVANRFGKTPYTFTGMPEQNNQNDFDFIVSTQKGQKYLELMEIAPLEGIHGGYDAADNKYHPYDLAESILQKIILKSIAYASTLEKGILLLMYNTDWKFNLSETSIALLQYWTLNKQHRFEGIFLFLPLEQDFGLIYTIYPTSRQFFRGFNPEIYRDNVTYNFDPRKWRYRKDPSNSSSE